MQKVRNKRKIYWIALIIVLLLVGGFFGYKAYSKHVFNKDVGIFQEGAKYGYTQAILQVINISDTCKPFPVYVGNDSRELVSVTCFKDKM